MKVLNILINLKKSHTQELNHIATKLQVKLDGICFKQDKVLSPYKHKVNIYIVCKINLWSYTQGADFAVTSYLIGAVKFT